MSTSMLGLSLVVMHKTDPLFETNNLGTLRPAFTFYNMTVLRR